MRWVQAVAFWVFLGMSLWPETHSNAVDLVRSFKRKSGCSLSLGFQRKWVAFSTFTKITKMILNTIIIIVSFLKSVQVSFQMKNSKFNSTVWNENIVCLQVHKQVSKANVFMWKK